MYDVFVRVPLVQYYIVRAVNVNINNEFLKKKIIHGLKMKVKYYIKTGWAGRM